MNILTDNFLYFLAVLASGIIAGFALFAIFRRITSGRELQDTRKKAQKLLQDAQKEAESIKKEAELTAKDHTLRSKAESDKELRERRTELSQHDRRLRHR